MSKYQKSKSQESNFRSRFSIRKNLPILFGCVGTIILIILCIFPFRNKAEFSDWMSIITIGLSLWTLAAAFYISTSNYEREKRDAEIKEKERRNNTLNFIRPVIEEAVYWLMNPSSSGVDQIRSRVKNFVYPCIGSLTGFLSQRNSETLVSLVELFNVKHNSDDKVEFNLSCGFLYRDWLRPIMSGYHLYNSNAENMFDLLSEDLYNLLNQLGVEGAERPYIEGRDIIRDKKGGILYEKTDRIHDDAQRFADSVYNSYKDEFPLMQYEIQVNPDNDIISVPQYQNRENFVNVFNYGKLICSGEIDPATSKVANGFVDIQSTDGTNEFVGFVKDGLRFGPGIDYDGEHKLNEGYWFSDNMSAGVQHNFIIKDENNSLKWNPDIADYERNGELVVFGRYYDSSCVNKIFLHLREDLLFQSGFDSYYIADRIIVEEDPNNHYYHFRKLQDFLADENPDYLSWLFNLGGH